MWCGTHLPYLAWKDFFLSLMSSPHDNLWCFCLFRWIGREALLAAWWLNCRTGLMWGTDPIYKLDLDEVLGKGAKLQNELILISPGCFFSWPVRYRRPQAVNSSVSKWAAWEVGHWVNAHRSAFCKMCKVKTSVLCLFFRKLLGANLCLAKSRLCSPGACLSLLLKVKFWSLFNERHWNF